MGKSLCSLPIVPMTVIVFLLPVSGAAAHQSTQGLPGALTAVTLKPLSLRVGCKQGRRFANRSMGMVLNDGSEVVDLVTSRCYRRSQYAVVTEYTQFYDDGYMCDVRGITTDHGRSWHWRSYVLSCYTGDR